MYTCVSVTRWAFVNTKPTKSVGKLQQNSPKTVKTRAPFLFIFGYLSFITWQNWNIYPSPSTPISPSFFFFFVWLILLSSAALFLHCSYEWRRPSVQHRGWASKLMNFRELFSTSKTHGQQFLFKGVRVTCSWKRAKPFYTRLCPWFNVKSWEFWSQLHCKVVSIQWWSTEISSLLWWDEHRRCYERILSTSKCKNKTSSRVKCMIHFLPWGWRKVFFRYIGKYIDL